MFLELVASELHRSKVLTDMLNGNEPSCIAADSGRKSRASALSLNAFPYRAIQIPHDRPYKRFYWSDS